MILKKLSLVLCLFFTSTFTAQWAHYVFKVHHHLNFLLLPESNWARYYGEFIVDGYLINMTHYILKGREFEVIIRGQDIKDIKLSKCVLFADEAVSFHTPFMMIADDGRLKEIRVTKGEAQQMVNFKLLLTTIVQKHFSKVLEQDVPQFSTKTKEITAHGVCEVDYHVEQPTPNPNKIYHLQKNFSIESCVYFHEPTESYLLPQCSKLPHKQERGSRSTDMTFELTNTPSFDDKLHIEFSSYRPFEASTDRMLATSLFNVSLQSLDFVDEIPYIESALEVKVTEITKVKVNETLFYDDTTAKNAKLRNMYKGLSCCSEMNMYSTSVGQALVCDA